MQTGYIKLYRRSLSNGWLRNHKLWALWTWSLLKASHKEHTVNVGGQEVTLKAGQFIFGRRMAALETGLTEKEVRNRAKTLLQRQNWAIKRANKFSIVTIVNWATYQGEGNEKGQQKGQQRASKGPQTRMVENGKNNTNGHFEIFWKAWPKKVDKQNAEKVFAKINPDESLLQIMLKAIETQKRSKQWETMEYIPGPAKWLRGRRWEDELEPGSDSRF